MRDFRKMPDALEYSKGFKAENRGPIVLAVCWSFVAIATLFVVARLFVRGALQRRLWADDYFTIMALVWTSHHLCRVCTDVDFLEDMWLYIDGTLVGCRIIREW